MRRVAALRALWGVVRGRRPGTPSAGEALRGFARAVPLGLTGRYPYLDRSRLVLMAAAAVYIVSPIDAMPEILLSVFGLGDDAVVLAWLFGAAISEGEVFLAWDASRARTVAGEVVE